MSQESSDQLTNPHGRVYRLGVGALLDGELELTSTGGGLLPTVPPYSHCLHAGLTMYSSLDASSPFDGGSGSSSSALGDSNFSCTVNINVTLPPIMGSGKWGPGR